MAITKVGTYRNPPEDKTDYEAIVAHLEAYTRQIGNQGMILTEWANDTTAPKIAMGSYISHGGVLYVVEDEDYGLPALSSDGTYYLRVSASGDTLAITYTTNIADYSWNAVYGGLYHADESQVLPYQVVKNASVIWKYKMLNLWQNNDFAAVNYLGRYQGRELRVTGAISGASLAVTGAISGASIDTGQGTTEVYLMNQNVRTTDSPTFEGVNVVSGAVTARFLAKGVTATTYNQRYFEYSGDRTESVWYYWLFNFLDAGESLLMSGFYKDGADNINLVTRAVGVGATSYEIHWFRVDGTTGVTTVVRDDTTVMSKVVHICVG